jgi:hypothetical protein
MSSMTTLEKVYDRVANMARLHEDRLIPVDDVSFTDLESVCISGATYNLRPIAQQNICYRLGIPIHYLRKCPQHIQQNNLNYWIKHEKNEKLFFRFDGGDVRAIFTPRYIPTDNKEVLDRLLEHGYKPNTRVQCSLDDEFMLVSVPDDRETFRINGDRMTPGISISNSEVGLAALSISTFTLRLVCTNGMISKTEVSASYRHVSDNLLSSLPGVLNELKAGFGQQREQFQISLESKVDNPEATIDSFNRQFELRKEEKEAVEWALTQEYGFTMFSVVNTYTKAAQYELLSAESRFRLQKVGGTVLGMVN